MTTKNHNKKRNSLLMYEFLVRTISRSLVDDNKKKSAAALKILRKHFKPGTELYREFRLMNALVKTTVSSEHVASSILKEARSAAAGFDLDRLDREKSLLIRNVNHNLNDEDFYDQYVTEYKILATIQTLINEWRSTNKDLYAVGQYEDQLMRHLTTKKEEKSQTELTEDSTGTARLLMKVMTKRLNDKYGGVLNDQQRSLVKAYAYSTASDDPETIRRKLQEIRQGLIVLVDDYVAEHSNNQFLKDKIVETKEALLNESFDSIDDGTVTRFMLYSRLKDELESKE